MKNTIMVIAFLSLMFFINKQVGDLWFFALLLLFMAFLADGISIYFYSRQQYYFMQYLYRIDNTLRSMLEQDE